MHWKWLSASWFKLAFKQPIVINIALFSPLLIGLVSSIQCQLIIELLQIIKQIVTIILRDFVG